MRGLSCLWVASVAVLAAACSGGGSSPASSPSTPPVASPSPPPPPPAPTVESETDVVYGSGLLKVGSLSLRLDIYQPSETCESPRPFVLGIHGGGFVGGSKSDSNWVGNMEAVAARGYVGLSMDYRLRGDDPVVGLEFEPILDDFLAVAAQLGVDESQFPTLTAAVAAFEDTTAALDWARANADARCLDMDRFALWGSSAGAITALHVAHGLDEYSIERPDPLVVVDYWGRLFLPDLVDTNGPPIMIIHGTSDSTVDYDDSALPLAAEADAAGVPLTFYTIQDGPHGFSAINPDRVSINGQTGLDVTLDFIDAHLTGGEPLYETQVIIPTP